MALWHGKHPGAFNFDLEGEHVVMDSKQFLIQIQKYFIYILYL